MNNYWFYNNVSLLSLHYYYDKKNAFAVRFLCDKIIGCQVSAHPARGEANKVGYATTARTFTSPIPGR
jgi:hypothetical protein